MEKAKQDEIGGLEVRQLWSNVRPMDLPRMMTILGDRFFTAIQTPNSSAAKAKPRFVLKGQTDEEKPFEVHDSHKTRQSSTRFVVS